MFINTLLKWQPHERKTMKPGQTSVRNGVEDFLFPMETLGISQGNNGTFSHQFQYALDLVGQDTTRERAYFPATSKCVAVDRKNFAVTWQTVNPVRCADGVVRYVTYTLMHDNDFTGIEVGAVYPQGHQVAMEGDGGYVTGVHLHNEVAPNVFSKQWEQNPKSRFLRLPNGVSADQMYFIDGTKLRNNGNPIGSGDTMNWKTTSDIPVVKPTPPTNVGDLKIYYENGKFTLSVDIINFRNAPTKSAPVEGKYGKGDSVYYDRYVKNEGYVWISWISQSTGARRYMACRVIATNEAWGSFE